MLKRKWPLFGSIGHAGYGIWIAFRDERNMRIHAALTLLAMVLMFVLKISVIEGLILSLDIALVWIAELMNSAIEESFNIHSRNQDRQIKLGKDVAAGAVLVAAINALIAGYIIFLPKIIPLIK